MSWLDMFYHPLWVFSTLLLSFVVRRQRRGRWDPRACTVRLNGKTAIVTGANTGIGKFIALDFAQRGARVILACRSEARGTAAVKEIREKTKNADVHLRLVDLSSLESVREFAKRIIEEEKALHILVNNAGVSGDPTGTLQRTAHFKATVNNISKTDTKMSISLPRQITKDGLDISFATNHLGPFLLTNLLLDLIKRSAPARIVNLASVNHKKGKVDFSHFQGENLVYHMDNVYNHTKLHNVICTNELARRLQGTGVTANSVHPGIVMTEVLRYYPLYIRFIFNFIGICFFKSAEEGAVSSIYCAVAEEMEGVTGKYIDSDCSMVLPAPLARDTALAVKDFEVSERLTSKL